MQSESNLQSKCVMWFRNEYCRTNKETPCIIFSVPNENNYNKINTGVLAGVSDIIVLIPRDVLFFEFKTETGKQTDKQKTFEKSVNCLGFNYHVVRTFEEFKNLIDSYLL